MPNTRFRADLRRGLGCCYLELARCPDIRRYREDILWACRYAVAYDTQSEGTRAIYLYDMIRLFDDQTEFLAVLADGAKRDIKDRGFRFAHETDILALMAGDGCVAARQVLEELYDLLTAALRSGRPGRRGTWPALENFSMLCVAIMTNATPREKAGDFFLQVLADHGRLIRMRPGLGDWFEDEWLEDVAADKFGEERLRALLRKGEDDPDVARYLQNRERLTQKRREYQADRMVKTEASSVRRVYEKRRGKTQPAEARARSLARLREDPKDADALCVLLANYHPGDGEMIVPLVRGLPVRESQGDWHEVFSDVRRLIASVPSADGELSAALLPYIYRRGFCSFCRCETLELMADRGLLTPALLEECRHDCDLEIRDLAEAVKPLPNDPTGDGAHGGPAM